MNYLSSLDIRGFVTDRPISYEKYTTLCRFELSSPPGPTPSDSVRQSSPTASPDNCLSPSFLSYRTRRIQFQSYVESLPLDFGHPPLISSSLLGAYIRSIPSTHEFPPRTVNHGGRRRPTAYSPSRPGVCDVQDSKEKV